MSAGGSARRPVEFGAFQLPTVLARAVADVGTGRATVLQGSAQRQIWFVERRVRLISSSLEAGRMGKWLVARGLVEPRAVAELPAACQPSERLGGAVARCVALEVAGDYDRRRTLRRWDVRKLMLLVVMLTVAAGAGATTLVLKGGKRLEVAGVQRQGNYFVVKYASGRVESYPVLAVDLEATKAANQPATPAAAPVAPVQPVGPHSPFYGAQSNPGKPVVVVTDNDVQHIVPAEDSEPTGEAKAAQRSSTEGMVTLVDYGKQKAEDGTWEITANVINTGGAAVAGISADVRLLDDKGATVGSGTATYAGTLGPSQQASMTTRVSCPVEPIQIGFSFRWQTVTPQPTPVPAAAAPAAGGKPSSSAAKAPAPGAGQPAGYTVPPGSSPNTMASDPMAVPSLTTPPTSLQVPRGTSPAKQPG